MAWEVLFHDAFRAEYAEYEDAVRDRLLAALIRLQDEGSRLGRPTVDTLTGSKHANMKELRVKVDQNVWRVAFAFDPRQNAVLLVGGDKAGKSQRQFYRRLISVADRRYDDYLEVLGAG